ncbi:MAG: ChaN family lipoprotein [Pseudohongiellaceae bacterium]
MKYTSNGSPWEASINRSADNLITIITKTLSFTCVLACAGVAAQAQSLAVPDWKSSLNRDHPLVGSIWHSGSERFVTSEELVDAIASSRYFLLGEKHDNPDHHTLQLEIVTRLLADDAVSLISFEMIMRDSQQRLEGIRDQNLETLEALRQYLQWDEQGWNWEFYGPLIFAALTSEIPINAANITDEEVRNIYQEPLDEEVAAALSEDVVARLNSDIDESHCSLLPASQFPAMVRVQQARDYSMAGSLVAPDLARPQQPAVLIAGNYHIRHDLGVPNYIRILDPAGASATVTLALLEVDAGLENPQSYLDRFGEIAAYDYLWFTPAISSEDYCASLR